MPVLPTDNIKDPSPQLRAILRWLDAVTTSHDIKALDSLLTDDYVHHNYPQSLKLQSYDKAAFLPYAETVLMPLLTEYNASLSTF